MQNNQSKLNFKNNNFKVKDEEEEDKEYQNVNVEYVDDIMDKLIEVINFLFKIIMKIFFKLKKLE